MAAICAPSRISPASRPTSTADFAGDDIVVAGEDLDRHAPARQRGDGGPGALLRRVEEGDIAQQCQIALVGDRVGGLSGGHYTPVMLGVVSTVWCLSLAALAVLWLRRPHFVLDVWLMVVMCAWLFDIALSAILNVARFDVGFYLGRIYGLCAASFVLAILLDRQCRPAGQAGSPARTWSAGKPPPRDDLRTEREGLFSAVVESSNDAIITKLLDGTITGWNGAAERLFGFTAAEAIGKSINIIVPPDRRDEVRNIVERISRGEPIEHFETSRVRKDGSTVDVSLSISPIRSASGKIVGISKAARDITESKRTQHALSQEIEERRRIFDSSNDLILVTDTAGNFIQVSPSVTAILGYQPSDMIGHSAVEFIHPDDLEHTRREMRAARRGQSKRNFETRYVNKEGKAVALNWTGTWSEPVRRHFFIGRDLTEKQAAEAQLRHAQKMDAVGQLTGGVAHDFNNILTVITGTIGILEEAVADQPQLAAIAKLIDEAAERGANLTKHLLAFARKQPLQPVEVDVNALVLEAAKLLHPTLGEHIEITPLSGRGCMDRAGRSEPAHHGRSQSGNQCARCHAQRRQARARDQQRLSRRKLRRHATARSRPATT